MNTSNKNYEFRQECLEKARVQLKKEFFGIDDIIDRIINSITSWYMMPEIQKKPTVINLWGLTGTGKSSLVESLAGLLDESLMKFDLGDQTPRSFTNTLIDISRYYRDKPLIMMFDEFHLAKTVNENGHELRKFDLRVIWEMLDKGAFSLNVFEDDLYTLEDFRGFFKRFMYSGGEIKNGKIVRGKKIYRKRFERDKEQPEIMLEYEMERIAFLMNRMSDNKPETEFYSVDDVRDRLGKMNTVDVLKFINEIIKKATIPQKVSCNKALIFVIANIDEAYKMALDFNPDINADDFKRETDKISVSDIRYSLLSRFRAEQVARLGSNHIIYPALSSDSYKKIIRKELHAVKMDIKKEYGLDLEFSPSLERLLYKEGVVPTQGTRPLLSTVHRLVHSLLGKIISYPDLKNLKVEKIVLSTIKNKMVVRYFNQGFEISRFEESLILLQESRRKARKDNLQALVAVHESGHAVAGIMLMNLLPKYIYSISADSNSLGFTYFDHSPEVYTHKELVERIAMLYGGIEAERLIFGEGHVTSGSQSDILRATSLASYSIKVQGLGSVAHASQISLLCSESYVWDEDAGLNREIKDLLEEGRKLAAEILHANLQLLLILSEKLMNKPRLMARDIRKILKQNGQKLPGSALEENQLRIGYRSMLKEKIGSGPGIKQLKAVQAELPVELNSLFQ